MLRPSAKSLTTKRSFRYLRRRISLYRPSGIKSIGRLAIFRSNLLSQMKQSKTEMTRFNNLRLHRRSLQVAKISSKSHMILCKQNYARSSKKTTLFLRQKRRIKKVQVRERRARAKIIMTTISHLSYRMNSDRSTLSFAKKTRSLKNLSAKPKHTTLRSRMMA